MLKLSVAVVDVLLVEGGGTGDIVLEESVELCSLGLDDLFELGEGELVGGDGLEGGDDGLDFGGYGERKRWFGGAGNATVAGVALFDRRDVLGFVGFGGGVEHGRDNVFSEEFVSVAKSYSLFLQSLINLHYLSTTLANSFPSPNPLTYFQFSTHSSTIINIFSRHSKFLSSVSEIYSACFPLSIESSAICSTISATYFANSLLNFSLFFSTQSLASWIVE